MVVTEVSTDEIQDLFEARRALEVAAAALAAKRRDPRPFEELRDLLQGADELVDEADASRHAYYALANRLDSTIDDAVDNTYLLGPLRTMRAHVARIRRISWDNPARLRDAAREHLMITDAIIDGAPQVAAYAMELHLHRSLASIVGALLEQQAGKGTTIPDIHTSNRRKA